MHGCNGQKVSLSTIGLHKLYFKNKNYNVIFYVRLTDWKKWYAIGKTYI